MRDNSSTINFETVADVRALLMAVTARLVRQGEFKAALLGGKGILKAAEIKRRYDVLLGEYTDAQIQAQAALQAA